jgi:hypothetical protein
MRVARGLFRLWWVALGCNPPNEAVNWDGLWIKPDESSLRSGLLPPPHPAEQSATGEDQTGKASASDGAGDNGGYHYVVELVGKILANALMPLNISQATEADKMECRESEG